MHSHRIGLARAFVGWIVFALGVSSAIHAQGEPVPTVRSKTEMSDGALVCTLELVHSDKAMRISTISIPMAEFLAHGLSAPAGLTPDPQSAAALKARSGSQRASALAAEPVMLVGRIELEPGKRVTLRFPMIGTSDAPIEMNGILEYGHGLESEGEAFVFDVVYPCPVWREGAVWNDMPAACKR